MKRLSFLIALAITVYSCGNDTNKALTITVNADASFTGFKDRFIDAYWKQNPSYAIYSGYGKYYDELKIPDSAAFAGDVQFAKNYLDSLQAFSFEGLSAGNKIDYRILENQLRSTIWYTDTFKIQEWDPSGYNIGGECYELINKNYAPLTERLRTLSNHLKMAPGFYAAALKMIKQPTKEHTDLAMLQNAGSLDVFGKMLTDSVNTSSLSAAEKDTLKIRVAAATDAIKNYVSELKKILADKDYPFRSYRIGDTLFNRKFHYDIVTDYSAKAIFDKAIAAKQAYHEEMYRISNELWAKYFSNQSKPADTLQLIKMMIDKIALDHVSPEHLVDTISQQVHDLERFIIEKDLFAYDTSSPLKVRIMPAYMSGSSVASASSGGPYDKKGIAYYNISDLTKIPKLKAESQLREHNKYTLQILSIHEAMPGHCMQGVYSNKSSSIVKAVFGNGAMIEGWAVYTQRMMLENGWANNSPEMWLMFYKWSLRECCNVIVDYGIQSLNYSKEKVVKMLKDEAFQEDAQIEEKYHRATISQVQLCSYFTGDTEILALRDAFKKKEGDGFSLKKFHEQFLSYGSAPVMYISELMLGK
ncbi:MAG TPA: DUF885 domain-containing protein [Panacibacter sp.]|nr:DUF885 domain-containing protein [Panacibacter sp.]